MFPDKSRIMALGDSITQDGRWHLGVQCYLVGRFPEKRFYFRNAGIGGDSAQRVLDRFDSEVRPWRPSVLFLMLGMNDLGSAYGPKYSASEMKAYKDGLFAPYREKMKALVSRTKNELGAKLILITPSPYDQTATIAQSAEVGRNDALAEASEFVKTLANEEGCPLVDFHGPMTALNLRAQTIDPAFTLCGTDRVHPQGLGHTAMAYLFLKSLGAPAEVCRLELDAARKKVSASENGTVRALKFGSSGVSFEWRSGALPWFPDTEGSGGTGPLSLASLLPIEKDLNVEKLVVQGLEQGRYLLKTGADVLGVFDAETLANGVALGMHPASPRFARAFQIREKLRVRKDLEMRLRIIHYIGKSMGREKIDLSRTDLIAGKVRALHVWVGNYDTAYFDARRRLSEIEAEMKALEDEAHRLARPEFYSYRLEKA